VQSINYFNQTYSGFCTCTNCSGWKQN